jgi:hypothetical protein
MSIYEYALSRGERMPILGDYNLYLNISKYRDPNTKISIPIWELLNTTEIQCDLLYKTPKSRPPRKHKLKVEYMVLDLYLPTGPKMPRLRDRLCTTAPAIY